ncbi:CDP-diacylglycerol--serine O-phosphatidyltransferase [Aliikangiella sp. G2MR2-5]|uniref:CDP-diacylglycerol--serine O-phosphatidyltransferase n=1 Tax=Aliikangiella sp. G2MR2-5 TaxID=2788943 RepID=UPI0018AB30FD|nr:CDP-diacylglycerol--serine O-phosphatidyltransferase [Aliikangiella sp. G2MR2-5]
MNIRRKPASLIPQLGYFNVAADKVSILEKTSEFKTKILALVAAAKKRIYMTALYLQDDDAGKEILTAIYEAKQKNPELDVKIFVDFSRAQRGLMGHAQSIGNVRLYREYAAKYENPIDVLGVPVKSKEMLGVLHLKGFVFDNTLFYSGASLNNIYLQQEERYRYDRYHLIECKKLADSMVNFLKNYLGKAPAVRSLSEEDIPSKKQLKPAMKMLKKNLRKAHYKVKPEKETLSGKQVAVTPLLGFGGRANLLNQTIYEMVRDTERTVTIFTPYFNLPKKVSKAARRILKNGKTVNIVVGDKVANDFYIPEDQPFNKVGIVPYVYETNLKRFIKRNQKFVSEGLLNVYLWRHDANSFHLKGMSRDGEYHLLTGHNINPRAWSLDLENGVLVQDPNQLLEDAFESEYQTILTHTKRISHFNDIESIKDYPEAAKKLMKNVKRAKLDSILNRLL